MGELPQLRLVEVDVSPESVCGPDGCESAAEVAESGEPALTPDGTGSD